MNKQAMLRNTRVQHNRQMMQMDADFQEEQTCCGNVCVFFGVNIELKAFQQLIGKTYQLPDDQGKNATVRRYASSMFMVSGLSGAMPDYGVQQVDHKRFIFNLRVSALAADK